MRARGPGGNTEQNARKTKKPSTPSNGSEQSIQITIDHAFSKFFNRARNTFGQPDRCAIVKSFGAWSHSFVVCSSPPSLARCGCYEAMKILPANATDVLVTFRAHRPVSSPICAVDRQCDGVPWREGEEEIWLRKGDRYAQEVRAGARWGASTAPVTSQPLLSRVGHVIGQMNANSGSKTVHYPWLLGT